MDLIIETVHLLFPNNFTQRAFKASFGTSLPTAVILWRVLQIHSDIIQPIHLLWSLEFLKVYATTDVSAFKWHCDAKTYRLYVWRVLFLLYVNLNTV